MLKKLPLLLALLALPAWAADSVTPGAKTETTTQSQPATSSGSATPTTSPTTTTTSPATSTQSCPTGCVYIHCPPPNGAYACCNTSTYKTC